MSSAHSSLDLISNPGQFLHISVFMFSYIYFIIDISHIKWLLIIIAVILIDDRESIRHSLIIQNFVTRFQVNIDLTIFSTIIAFTLTKLKRYQIFFFQPLRIYCKYILVIFIFVRTLAFTPHYFQNILSISIVLLILNLLPTFQHSLLIIYFFNRYCFCKGIFEQHSMLNLAKETQK